MNKGLQLLRALVLEGVLAAALIGCGADANDVRTASGQEVAVTNRPDVHKTGVVVRVLATDNLFRAPNTSAKVGDTVQWTNKGKNDHDVLPQEGNAWGVRTEGFHPGAVYEYVFNEPGAYAYYCSIHGTNKAGMVATITVTK